MLSMEVMLLSIISLEIKCCSVSHGYIKLKVAKSGGRLDMPLPAAWV